MMEAKVATYVRDLRKKGVCVNQTMVINKALATIKEDYPEAEFKGSTGWCAKFLYRNRFRQRRVTR